MRRQLPFVVGTDIVQISRFSPTQKPAAFLKLAQRILRRDEVPPHVEVMDHATHGHPNLHNWLTVRQSKPNLDSEVGIYRYNLEAQKASRWLAGRWAAKEAAMKAWGAGLLGYKDVRVTQDHDGPFVPGSSKPVKVQCRPYLEDMSQHSGEQRQNAEGDIEQLQQDGRLSISHDGDYCVATVIAEPLDRELLMFFQERLRAVQERQANEWKSSRAGDRSNRKPDG